MQHSNLKYKPIIHFNHLSGWCQIRLLLSMWHNAAFSNYVCSFFLNIYFLKEYKAIILPEHLTSGYQTSGTTWRLISLMCHKVCFYCSLFMCTPLGFNNCSVRLCGTVWGQKAPTELQQVLIAVLFMNNGRQSFFLMFPSQVFCWYERILQVN